MIDYKIEIYDTEEYLMILFVDTDNNTIAKIDTVKDTTKELYIASLFVKADYRRYGLSKLIFEKFLELIASPKYMNIERVCLDVMPINDCDIDWLVSYYKNLGFQIVNKYPNRITYMVFYL